MNEMENTAERPTRVLIVDDDQRLQAVVREFLENYNYEIHSLTSGRGLPQALNDLNPDILLLDVMLPGEDGFTLLRELRADRENGRLPVIMLTACGGDADRITGLEIGADDYLPKPFNPRELLARVKAVLRRSAPDYSDAGSQGKTGTGAAASNLLHQGGLTLDSRRQQISRGEKHQELSTTEFRILQAFMGRPGEILSREQVLALAFGEDHYVSDRNIDVYISRLRAILRKLGETETRIRTVWGSGYAWVALEEGKP